MSNYPVGTLPNTGDRVLAYRPEEKCWLSGTYNRRLGFGDYGVLELDEPFNKLKQLGWSNFSHWQYL